MGRISRSSSLHSEVDEHAERSTDSVASARVFAFHSLPLRAIALRMSAPMLALATLLFVCGVFAAGCAAPQQPGPTPQSKPLSTQGRWSGTFTAQDQTSGGQVRITVAADGGVDGSLVDSVWQRIHGTARTGVLSGSIAAGSAQVVIVWSTGQRDRFDGTAFSPSLGSLGINLSRYDSSGNFAQDGGLTVALHEAGVAAQPPFVEPPTKPLDAMARWVGKWTANFYDRSGNAGTGSITVVAYGSLRGVLIDDAWSDGNPGKPVRQATLAGSVDDSGVLALSVQWSDGAQLLLSGVGYFQEPETAVFQLGPSRESVAKDGPALTLTIGRD